MDDMEPRPVRDAVRQPELPAQRAVFGRGIGDRDPLARSVGLHVDHQLVEVVLEIQRRSKCSEPKQRILRDAPAGEKPDILSREADVRPLRSVIVSRTIDWRQEASGGNVEGPDFVVIIVEPGPERNDLHIRGGPPAKQQAFAMIVIVGPIGKFGRAGGEPRADTQGAADR